MVVRNRRVFIGGIGVAIAIMLAAIVVPLYRGYIEREREVVSITRAIIASQRMEKSRTGKFYSASTAEEFKARGVGVSNTKFFTYETAPRRFKGFTITATPTGAYTHAFGAGEGPITYTLRE